MSTLAPACHFIYRAGPHHARHAAGLLLHAAPAALPPRAVGHFLRNCRSLSAATSNPGIVLPQGVTIEGAVVDRRTLRVAWSVALFGGLLTVLMALLAMRVCISVIRAFRYLRYITD